MITAWILTFVLNTGTVEVYSVYSTAGDCYAQAAVMQPVVDGSIECIAVSYQMGPRG